MKAFIFAALTLMMAVDPSTVKKINETKEAAEEAFKSGNYTEAARHYKTLVDSLGVSEDAVMLNLANACYLAKDTANAFNYYQSVVASPEPDISSKAHQQLGIMLNKRGKAEQALAQFKAAIKAEPTNDDARYNYEMLKKKLEEEKKKQQEQQQQNKDQKNDQQNKDKQNEEQKNKDQQQKDQENKDEQNKEQQQKEQEQKEKEQKEQQEKEQQEKEKQEQQQKDAKKEEMPNLDREKLEEMKISEEKARMILEAMKNQERQYLQQQRRKPSQPKDPNKPDW